MISLQNISFQYPKTPKSEGLIFNNMTIDIFTGHVIGIIGSNGAGKTTLYDIITDILEPQEGEVKRKVSNADWILMTQNQNLPWRMKVKEIIDFIFCLNQHTSSLDIDKLVLSLSQTEKVRLNKIWNREIGICSTGERRWLVLILTLYFNKQLYLLDEPTAGVDPEYRHLIWERIISKKNSERAILVSSHLLDEIGRYADCFYFIHNKTLEKYNNINEFQNHYNAKSPEEAFLKANLIVS